MSPYQKQLEALKERGESVTINRADAADVTGRIVAVDDDGCAIGVRHGLETMQTVFVAHRDIRGVCSTDWDYDIIAA